VHVPRFGLHAKTMVIDGEVLFVGTFNLDPRSQNLNTEVGVIVRDARVAAPVEAAIETDMGSGNSWSARDDDPDRFAAWTKRAQVRAFQALPLRPLL
jgi:putative cardiolipin synthase